MRWPSVKSAGAVRVGIAQTLQIICVIIRGVLTTVIIVATQKKENSPPPPFIRWCGPIRWWESGAIRE